MDHATRAVLAQPRVGGAPEEVPGFRPLLARASAYCGTACPSRPHPRRGHGRVEHRTLKAVTVGHFGLPTPPRSCGSSARPILCGPVGGRP